MNGELGLVWAPSWPPRVVWAFSVPDGKIAAIEQFADRERIRQLDLVLLDD